MQRLLTCFSTRIGRSVTLLMMLLLPLLGWGQTTIFTETFGAPTGTTTIAVYAAGTSPTTFSTKPLGYTYSNGGQTNSADIRASSPLSGYPGASGTGNVFFTQATNNIGFAIGGINASAYTNLQLSFGIRRDNTGTYGVLVEYSTDGVTYTGTGVVVSNLPLGTAATGTAPTKATATLPVGAQSGTLSIRFTKTGTAAAVRLDDIVLSGTGSSPSLTPSAAPLSGFTYAFGSGPSAEQSFTISGSNLTGAPGDITASVPAGSNYEVSTTSGSGFTTSVMVPYTTATPSATGPVYVRLKSGLAGGNYAETLTLSGGGATSTIALTGVVTALATDVYVPQFALASGTTDGRVPYAFRITLSGLTPSATYRYTTQAIKTTDALLAANVRGNSIFALQSGSFVRSSGPSLSSAGNYDSFTASATGTYTGWFVLETTSNTTTFPTGSIYPVVVLNDGTAANTTVTSLVTTNATVTLLPYGAAGGATAVYGRSGATARNIVLTYDNTAGTGRPLYASIVESDGTANTTANNYASFYSTAVNTVAGAYGLLTPSTNPNGIQRIEQRALADGTLVCANTDADGVWPSGVNTVNPTPTATAATAATALAIIATDAPLATATVTATVAPATGAVGTSVTIAGTNFMSGTTVSFNGTVATPSALSATSITVAVPAGATTGPVTVDTPGATSTCSASVAAGTFTIGAPAPTITTDAVTGAPVCATANADITVAFSTTGTLTGTYTVQLSDATGSFTSATNLTTTGSSSPLTATIPAGTASGTAYAVRVVNSTPATIGSASAPFTIISNTAITVAGTTPQTFNTNGSGTAVTASTASAVAPTYQWYYSTTANSNATATAIAGATSASYTPTAASLGGTVSTFYVSVRGNYPGCGDVVGSPEIVVNVTAAPATIAIYSTAGLANSAVASAPATTVAANASATSLVRGAGINAQNVANAGFASSDFASPATSTLATAIGGNDYLAFSITGNANYLTNVSSVALTARRTNAGPATVELVYSADASFATYSSLGTATIINGTNATFTFTPTGSALQGVTGTTYFRFYGYAASGTGNLYVLDNGSNNAVTVFGTVAASVPGTITVSTNGPLAVGTTTQATPSTPPVAYTVGGTSLGTSALVVQAPAGFQVSTDVAFTGITADGNSLSLAPSAGTVPTTTIYVRLSGVGSAGALSGNITNSSGISPVQSVAVTGTLSATPAEINLKQGTTSIASNGTYSGFSTISVGALSDQTFTIENLGGTPLTLGTFTATGDFSLPNATPTSVAAFGTATFTIRFQPTAAGTRTGSVSIVNSDSDENLYVLNLTAEATPAVPAITWTGTAGDNSFFTPANWSGNAVPGASDRVLLDHSTVAGAYTVTLDGGTTPTVAVSLISLTVNPGAGAAIELVLPATNTIQDAFTLTNTATGEAALAIYANGIVSNRSGSSTASGIVINGANPTFYLFNGGLYQHATARSSSAVTDNLAGVSGTENGTFVFNQAPFSAGSQVGLALQGRTFGNLTFDAADAFGYVSSGSNALVVNGNLTIASGTAFENGLSSTTLRGNLVNNGNVIMNGGQVFLSGTTTQTISGTPLGLSSGPAAPSYLGSSTTVTVNNPAGIVLATPVRVNGTLALTNGMVTTSATSLLTLVNNATGGSGMSYVNGPLARVTGAGAGTTVFPVGKGAAYRPLTLTATAQTSTTTYTGEVLNSSARTTSVDAPLTRVSNIRYATLTPDAPPTGFSGTLTLSFGADDYVSDPQASTLVVAKRTGAGTWQNIGRTSATGSAGAGNASGTLSSGVFTSFSDFALASTDAGTNNYLASNPLPVALTAFSAQRQADKSVSVRWATASEHNSARFEVQRSLNSRDFETVATVQAQGNSAKATAYAALDQMAPVAALYYRLRQVDRDGTVAYSPVVRVDGSALEWTVYPNPASAKLTVALPAAEGRTYRVLNTVGKVVNQGAAAEASPAIDVRLLPTGTYFLELHSAAGTQVRRFVKID